MRILSVILALLCAGCATYVTPGGPAPLELLNRAGVVEGSTRQPAPQLPASLAVARTQAAPYRSRSAEGLHDGRYSVIVTPDLPSAAQLQQIGRWPSVEKAEGLAPDWLPAKLESIDDLRTVAAKMQSDILLVCTLETVFKLGDQMVAPAAALAVGPKASGPATVSVIATAVFIDVRTGFVYGRNTGTGTADASAALATADAVDAKRVEAEHAAFDQLLTAAGQTWAGIARQYQ